MLDVKRWSTEWGGRELTDGSRSFCASGNCQSCTVRYGDTVILATVVQSDTKRAGH